MSEIMKEVEMELKDYETMCEQTKEHLKMLITGSCEASADEILTVAKALGEITDIKKDTVEMCYKKQIMQAMEDNADDYGKTWDENGRMYSEPMRKIYQMTPEMYKNNSPEHLRDMDKRKGLMYYTETPNMGSSEFDRSKRMYMETKQMNKPQDEKVMKLRKALDDLDNEIDDLVENASSEEHTIIRTKLQNKLNSL